MRRAWAEAEPGAWAGGAWASVQAGGLPPGLGKPHRVPGISADPRIASFHHFLNHILLGLSLAKTVPFIKDVASLT